MHDALPHVPIRMLGNRLLVLRDKSPKTMGLLEVPEAFREKLFSGVVLAAGPGGEKYCKTCRKGQGSFHVPVKRGDRVLWKRYAENSQSKPPHSFDLQDADGKDLELVFLDSETDLVAKDFEDRFELLRDLVAVRRVEPEKQRGGIIIPDSVQKAENEGTIVAVGPGGHGDDGQLLPMQFKIGQYVYWPEYAEQAEPAFKRYEKKGEQIVLLMEHMIEHAVDAAPKAFEGQRHVVEASP
jgi:chaperonin GroES